MGLGSSLKKIGGSVTGGLIGGNAGDLLGKITGSEQAAKGAQKAADAQLQSTRESNELLKELYGQTRADNAPFQLGGYAGLNALLALSGLPQVQGSQVAGFLGGASGTPAAGGVQSKELKLNQGYQMPTFEGDPTARLMADPGYQFRLQQGQKALDRQAAARGQLFSGRQLKATQDYAGGMASQQYGDTWNRLAQIAGIGQSANNAQQNASQSYGQSAGENILQGGNARASGYLARGNKQAQTFNSLMQLGQTGATAGMAFSDRRLKSNIEHIGQHPSGLNWYRYEIFGEPSEGVMADEVLQVRPEAVTQHESGFLMVDYGAL